MRPAFEHGIIRKWSRNDKTQPVELADNRIIWLNMDDRLVHPYTRVNGDEWFDYVALMRLPTPNHAA